MLTLHFFFWLGNIPLLMSNLIHPKCFWRMKQNEDKHGEVVTGCVFYLIAEQSSEVKVDLKENFRFALDVLIPTANHHFALPLAFAVDEINRNLYLLPNVSLIFAFFTDNYHDKQAFQNFIYFAAKRHRLPLNYICKDKTKCWVTLTGPMLAPSISLAHYFQFCKYPQLTYGPFHPILSDHEQFPNLYQMAPKDTALVLAMVSLMLHFNWNLVGLAISDDDQGLQFLSDLRAETEVQRVCLAFVIVIPVNMELYMSRAEVYNNQIETSSTNVVIIYGDTGSTLAVCFRMWVSQGIQRIWDTTSQWDVTTSKRDFTLGSFHGTLAFAHHHAEISGFKNFVQTLSPSKYTDISLTGLGWMYFSCEASTSNCKTLENCSSNVSLEWLMLQSFDMAFSDDAYDIYNAVYAMAHALHEMLLQQGENQPMNTVRSLDSDCSQLHLFLKKMHFVNPVGDVINMNQKEKLQADYGIYYISNFPHGVVLKVKIGEFKPYFPHGQQLHLNEDMIEWAAGNRQMPSAVCSVDCPPGFRKIHQEGMAACCFDCTPCPANEISNETDTDQCMKCREDQYANAEQNHCLYKDVTFLAFDDPLGVTLSSMALCLSAFTFLVLGIFVKHQDTPIVKANNLTLSYILLISFIFCFLCSLLFIGHPNSVTCILQQITYGVSFTVAVSTVLAKTITVVLAFKVNTPGRRMKWLLVSGAPTYIIPICIIIQIILCAIWLGTSPPSVDIDAHSEHGHIIIVCNKGSVTAFYSVLGYLGSLALGSFTVAFLARNLPDTFNEAKFLTFSMLLFCSVWVTFLPVYHSTKGKVMVAVEVFSILDSSAGLLGCIFVPKCYIILLRPERNSLQKLREKTFSRTHIS
ncbi:vomeronasal type-2 receptor 116-like isoform X2 [Peromyscus eremicus]|uniref:vomeronasal type-2 receptor 116-like isoform X2 n=1 Tax=Peromyscus eremicus TaxID=42410 RepID=UPI0027DD407A|nr:vomeronasal type-2 receptor 116-like isoform X2 [Peromyscus eremicus]